MFILDSLFLSGFRWVLDTVATAVDTEKNDDTALREQLLDAELRREMGEISDEEFRDVEADLLARIREIKEREGGSGAFAFGGQPMETTPDTRFEVEATVVGDFHEESSRSSKGWGGSSGSVIRGTVLESVPVAPKPRTNRTTRTDRTTGTNRTSRTARTSRTSRTTRKPPRT